MLKRYFSLAARHGAGVRLKYRQLMKEYPEAFVLYQVGDFYELYDEPAQRFAKLLDLRYNENRQIAGIPVQNSMNHIERLIKMGCSVVKLDQFKKGKRFDRMVTRIYTPGTIIEDSLLDKVNNNFLMSIYVFSNEEVGLAWMDISTGEYYTEITRAYDLESVLMKTDPKEIIISAKDYENFKKYIEKSCPKASVRLKGPESFCEANCLGKMPQNAVLIEEKWEKYFSDFQEWMNDFSLLEKKASMALIDYVESTQPTTKLLIDKPKRFSNHDKMILDATTLQSLDLLKHSCSDSKTSSLLNLMDVCVTGGASRALSSRLRSPWVSPARINDQLDITEFFFHRPIALSWIRQKMEKCHDLERNLRNLLNSALSPKDLYLVAESIITFTQLVEYIKSLNQNLPKLLEQWSAPASCPPLLELSKTIIDSLSDGILKDFTRGYIFKDGFDKELDKLRKLRGRSDRYLTKSELSSLVQSYRKNTKNTKLCITYTKTGGYMATNPVSQAKINFPGLHYYDSTTRHHRYRISDLNDRIAAFDSAEDAAVKREIQIFNDFKEQLGLSRYQIHEIAKSINEIDLSTSLAHLAQSYHYKRPLIDDSDNFNIQNGRHPILENMLFSKQRNIVSNSCQLGSSQIFSLITGPNMGGKSTYLRQNALLAIMAHAGSFIPADQAHIGVIDGVYTRIGANDNMSKDQSTFMLEMMETASKEESMSIRIYYDQCILSRATHRSLVIMDEIGRGTSYEDGLAIAYAVTDFLYRCNRSKVLFATHSHRLFDLLQNGSFEVKGIKYQRAEVLEDEETGEIINTFKIKDGVMKFSYGIEVARIAGLPSTCIQKATQILSIIRDKEKSPF